MNQKFMLVAMSTSVNPLGICEMPVRYLADHIGVGLRQAQRIIAQLIRFNLVAELEVAPEGRPVDIVRKFSLNQNIEPDSWGPSVAEESLCSDRGAKRILRPDYIREISQAVQKLGGKAMDDYLFLAMIDPVVVRSKQFDFVSPSPDVTNMVYEYKALIVDIVSRLSGSTVQRLHMIPRKGYR